MRACRGMQRWPVPPEFAERVRAAWPADRPRFWRTPPELRRLVGDLLRRVRSPMDDRWAARPAGREHRGRVVVPTVRDAGLSRLGPETFKAGTFHEETSTADLAADDGFVWCDRPTPGALYEAVTGLRSSDLRTTSVVCRIDGELIANVGSCDGGAYFAFERADYLYRPLGSIAD